MSEIAEFLRARYTAAREAEAGRRSIPGNLPFEWQWRRELDEEWIEIGSARIPVNDFVEQYGEPAADPDVISDLDAKLAIVDAYLPPGETPHPGQPCVNYEGQEPEDYDDYEACSRHVEASKKLLRHDYVLRLLAQPFAGHQDYKGEEWAP